MRFLQTAIMMAMILFCCCHPDAQNIEPNRTPNLRHKEQEMDDPSARPEFSRAINKVCPRSGKPIAADSLAMYRGRTVGFCNTHCRDDFVANTDANFKDRAFFDQIIDAKPQ